MNFQGQTNDQAKYEQIKAYRWEVAERNPSKCPCHGGGWILNPRDIWQECPAHYALQGHPEEEYYGEAPEETQKQKDAWLNMMRRVYKGFLQDIEALEGRKVGEMVKALTINKHGINPSPSDYIDVAENLLEQLLSEKESSSTYLDEQMEQMFLDAEASMF